MKGTKIYESLSDLDQFVENFREERNLIVHRSHQPKHERLDRYKRILYLIDLQEKFDLGFDEEQGEMFNKGLILRRLYKKREDGIGR